ncbi:MAG: hypothetical protein Kow0088_04090 [Anaerolineales bacterium]
MDPTEAVLPTSRTFPTPSLLATLPPLATQTPTPFPSLGEKVSVVFVSDQEAISVYANPAQTDAVIAQLAPNQTNIHLSGEIQEIDGQQWVEIQLDGGSKGWVNAQYLTPAIGADQFCLDERVQGYTDRILEIFRLRDGDRLAEIVSPIHGLRLRTHWSSPEVYLGGSEEVSELFTSSKTFSFGKGRQSQTLIQGTFMDVIYPLLLDVQDGGVETCNTLEQGLAADWLSGFIQWPFEYANLNYLARFRPAPPDNELDWRMWAFGIEWIDQQPYLTVMVHYQWDF